jgi:biotin-dependent carboxylase-like uncharacterized protein
MWKSLLVCKNDELAFSGCNYGCRAYISFAGGIAVPKIIGSRSTFIRGNYGGIEGRLLQAGDEIPLGISLISYSKTAGRKLQPEHIPDYEKGRVIRFIPGPQTSAFTSESLDVFTSNPYTVTNESDRMGYRLQGQQLKHVNGADIISDFITVGSIQVPAIGQPIILMADCQISGGYTKIGVIISADIPYIAQKKPKDQIHFQAIEVADAQEQWINQEKLMAHLRLANRMLGGSYEKN